MIYRISIFWTSIVEIRCNPSCLQEGNVKNQREHIVHLLANEQSRVGKPSGNEPVCDCLDTILLFLCITILDILMPDFLWNSTTITCHHSNKLAFSFWFFSWVSVLSISIYNTPLHEVAIFLEFFLHSWDVMYMSYSHVMLLCSLWKMKEWCAAHRKYLISIFSFLLNVF